MELSYALKNLIENGTNIEYFDKGYVVQINKQIKVYEDGKKQLRKLTQTQQNKLLLQARSGGVETKKKSSKQSVQKQIVDEQEDFINYEQQEERHRDIQEDMNESDDEIISQSERPERPIKQQRGTKQSHKRVIKASKQPQINYTNPYLDLKELIRLRTENTFIKQQHQDAIKQIEKYKQKVKRYKQPKQTLEKQEEQQEIQQEPVQQNYQPEQQFSEYDLYN